MKKLNFIIVAALAVSTIIMGCSTDSGSGSNSTESKKEDIQRPAKSDAEAKKLLGKYDSKVASIMRSLRKHKNEVKESDAKMTDALESNFNQLFDEAKQLKKQIEEVSDKLSEDDYGLFERSSERLREKEMDFESYKQNK
ncbi:MAG: hypothetical protein WEC59_08225 [Salibacteraceae bacterium]